MGPPGASRRVVPWFARSMTGMAFREVSVYEVREVLRVWLGAGGAGPAPGYRKVAERCGVDRKTVRRYVEAAEAVGLARSDPAGDEAHRNSPVMLIEIPHLGAGLL